MKTTRLRAYGTTALGTTALLASHSDAATVVDVNANMYDTKLPGIGVISRSGNGAPYSNANINTSAATKQSVGDDFRRGTDGSTVGVDSNGTFTTFNYATIDVTAGMATGQNGAQLNSSDNWFYARAPFSGEAVWMQFKFGGSGDGTNFSIIKALYPTTPGELSSAQAASSVPEPSSMALLALGASGLIRRRQRAA